MGTLPKLQGSPGHHDRRLQRLEQYWRWCFNTYEHSLDKSRRAKALALLSKIEKCMADIQAGTPQGMAVKLRCCLAREELEAETRPWAPLLGSLMDDLEA